MNYGKLYFKRISKSKRIILYRRGYNKTKELFERIILDQELQNKIHEVSEICYEALKIGAKVIFCGNGGSAADSQHLAAELVSKLSYG